MVCIKLQTRSVGTAAAVGAETSIILAGCIVPMNEFDYQNKLMGCVLWESVSEDNFVGITVSMQVLKYTFELSDCAFY